MYYLKSSVNLKLIRDRLHFIIPSTGSSVLNSMIKRVKHRCLAGFLDYTDTLYT
jgi:hypothetical protein